MGFFLLEDTVRTANNCKGVSYETLHRLECKICPLRNQPHIQHPNMEPTGAEKPDIYILGEAPGEAEDKHGEQFIGEEGEVLRLRLPSRWNKRIRWNNIVRTRPPQDRDPTEIEIEACRPSIIRDIEKSKPKAIFGFGNIPLAWALGVAGITMWRGRRLPVRIGNHTCWYYPIVHPSTILRGRRFTPRNYRQYGSSDEFAFAFDINKALDEVDAGLPEPVVYTVDDITKDVDYVLGGSGDLLTVLEHLRNAAKVKNVGIDYETNSLRPYRENAKILTIAVSTKDKTLSFPLDHSQSGWSREQRGTIFAAFRKFLMTAKCRKIVHHLSFEAEWSAAIFGPDTLHAGKWGDSLAQAYVRDERQGEPLGLNFLCKQHFGIWVKDILGKKLDRNNLDNESLPSVLRYNGIDAKCCRWLHAAQAELIREEGLTEPYAHILRRIPALVLTQYYGAPVDQKIVSEMRRKYERRLEQVERKLFDSAAVKRFHKITGRVFRPTISKDLQTLVTRVLGEPFEKGNELALEKVNDISIRRLIRWRKVAKVLSTYIKPLCPDSPNVYNNGTSLHCILSATSTRTSRTSSEDVNSQNYPKRGPAKEVRRQIRHRWKKFVAFDYAGIQARNVAMESKDKALVRAFWDRYDIHTDWTHRIAEICPAWVRDGTLKDKEFFGAKRAHAKNGFVFPSFFGAQPKSIAADLHIPESSAHRLHDKFWQMFPDVKTWHEVTKENYFRDGYVTGLSGFRRHAPVSPNELINAPIQADETIIVLEAMIRLSKMGDPRLQPVFEIHDDLTFLWDKEDIREMSAIVLTEMLRINFDWINVPLGVEMSVGDCWYSIGEGQKPETIFSDDWEGYDPNADNWADGVGWLHVDKRKRQ